MVGAFLSYDFLFLVVFVFYMSYFDLNLSDNSSRLFYLGSGLMFASAALNAYFEDYLIAILMALSAFFFALAGYYEPDENREE